MAAAGHPPHDLPLGEEREQPRNGDARDARPPGDLGHSRRMLASCTYELDHIEQSPEAADPGGAASLSLAQS
jgi:hypothetical protein